MKESDQLSLLLRLKAAQLLSRREIQPAHFLLSQLEISSILGGQDLVDFIVPQAHGRPCPGMREDLRFRF